MTTRRQVLMLAGAAVLAGCTERAGAGVPDLLLVDTSAGLALLRGIATKLLGTALATPTGTRLYTTGAAGGDTVLTSVAAASGAPTGRALLAGQWVPAVVAPDGQRLALTQPREAGDSGSRHTTILVADVRRLADPAQVLALPGDLEPDAFARGDQALFVLERLRAPDRYRVRLVDLATRRFTETLTRDKQPVPLGTEEQMYATARQAVLAPNHTTQYTLYQQQPGPKIPSESPAFVHTLDLTVGWAYCMDLPETLGAGRAESLTIAVTPDGRRVVVADVARGQVAIADTDTLTVKYLLDIPPGRGTAYAVAPPASELLYLGAGDTVTVVDLGVLNIVAMWSVGSPVRGLAVSADGTRLLVGYPGAVAWFDSGSGKPLGRLPVPGLTELRRVLTSAAP